MYNCYASILHGTEYRIDRIDIIPVVKLRVQGQQVRGKSTTGPAVARNIRMDEALMNPATPRTILPKHHNLYQNG